MTFEILPDSAYASLFACWNRGIIVVFRLGNWINMSDITLQSVQLFGFLIHFESDTFKENRPPSINIAWAPCFGWQSVKVFGFKRGSLSAFVFQPLIGSQTLFSHAVECNDSLLQDVRLTRGCLKSPSTSFFLNGLVFFPLSYSRFELEVIWCLHGSD